MYILILKATFALCEVGVYFLTKLNDAKEIIFTVSHLVVCTIQLLVSREFHGWKTQQEGMSFAPGTFDPVVTVFL